MPRLLVECPIEKVSSVQHSVKSKFPFDLIWPNAQVKGGERNYDGGHLELEGERRGFDVKGKGVLNQKQRSILRRRRRHAFDSGETSSVSSYDPLTSSAGGAPRSSISINKGDGIDGVSLSLADCGVGGKESSIVKPAQKESSLIKESVCNNKQIKPGSGEDNDQNSIRVLEQALEEEHAARSALYLELEKERNAAATAAEEAMAMILRLQKEKASVEMEARQYQRMIEEKSAYDAEEMNILKEILMRREREKHFLEKEVEAYRTMIFGNEGSENEAQESVGILGERDISEDPSVILQQISESVSKTEKIKTSKNFSEYEATMSIETQNLTVEFGKELPIPKWDNKQDSDLSLSSRKLEFEEKGIVDVNENLPIQEENFLEKNVETYNEAGTIILADGEEPSVHDVHVIDDELDKCNLISTDKTEAKIINRSNSAIASSGLPPTGNWRGKKAWSSDLIRRNSMSMVENEREKLDSEVGWLREKLRTVQEGRQKLNISMGHLEREKIQLLLLEDIASQLQEIRELTEPRQVFRPASLPPSSSKD